MRDTEGSDEAFRVKDHITRKCPFGEPPQAASHITLGEQNNIRIISYIAVPYFGVLPNTRTTSQTSSVATKGGTRVAPVCCSVAPTTACTAVFATSAEAADQPKAVLSPYCRYLRVVFSGTPAAHVRSPRLDVTTR